MADNEKGRRLVLLNSFASKVIAVALTSAAALVASPSYANSAAAADVSAPLRAVQDAKTTTTGGDQEFRKLFANWQNLEKTSVPSLADVGSAVGSTTPGSGRVNLISGVRVSGTLPYSGTQIAALPFRSLSSIHPSIPARTPIEGFRLTSEFGMREHPVLGGIRMHKGMDLAAPIGTPVHATADGIVERADWSNGYGLLVAIDHGGNIETRYGHMSRLAVASGQMVHKGDVIGFVGMTGRTTGPHLHYEVRLAGEAVNPMSYMPSADTGRLRLAAVTAGDAHD